MAAGQAMAEIPASCSSGLIKAPHLHLWGIIPGALMEEAANVAIIMMMPALLFMMATSS